MINLTREEEQQRMLKKWEDEQRAFFRPAIHQAIRELTETDTMDSIVDKIMQRANRNKLLEEERCCTASSVMFIVSMTNALRSDIRVVIESKLTELFETETRDPVQEFYEQALVSWWAKHKARYGGDLSFTARDCLGWLPEELKEIEK